MGANGRAISAHPGNNGEFTSPTSPMFRFPSCGLFLFLFSFFFFLAHGGAGVCHWQCSGPMIDRGRSMAMGLVLIPGGTSPLLYYCYWKDLEPSQLTPTMRTVFQRLARVQMQIKSRIRGNSTAFRASKKEANGETT